MLHRHITSASPHKVSLVTDALLESFDEFPERLIGDKACMTAPRGTRTGDDRNRDGPCLIEATGKSPRHKTDARCGNKNNLPPHITSSRIDVGGFEPLMPLSNNYGSLGIAVKAPHILCHQCVIAS